jgi:hypothetical protein
MGQDVGAVWYGAALNKVNADLRDLMAWEQACQEGRANPNQPPEHLRKHPSLWTRHSRSQIEEPSTGDEVAAASQSAGLTQNKTEAPNEH